MSDYQDYLDTVAYAPPTEVWNPKLGQNVNVTGNGGAGAYISANQNDYSGYGGAVTHINSTAIGADPFGGNTGTRNSPGGQLRSDYERTQMNPYDTTAKGAYQNDMNQLWPAIHVQRGVRPNFGFAPGYGTVDVNAGLRPTSWDQYDNSRKGWWSITPQEVQRLQSAGGNPTMKELMGNKTGLPDFGRGFDYNVATGGYSPHQMSTMQKIAQKYYYPALMAIGSAGMGAAPGAGIGGVIAGGAWGGLSQGAQDRFQHPWATALGTIGGGLGGYGGNVLGKSLEFGPTAIGALQGVTGSLGSGIGAKIGGAPTDWAAILRNAGISGIAGGVGGALTPEPVNGQPPSELSKLGSNLGRTGTQTILSTFLPGGPQPPRPLTPQEQEDVKRRQQAAAQQRQMNPYK